MYVNKTLRKKKIHKTAKKHIFFTNLGTCLSQKFNFRDKHVFNKKNKLKILVLLAFLTEDKSCFL